MTGYLVLIGDGMADEPLKELNGKTPLEAAKTPNLDFLAKNGMCGWTKNVPAGVEPGSDVAAMSIFGCDPKKYYTGRGPLEAAGLGVKLGEDEVAFRCNLVTVKDGRMKDFTAGHISTPEARKIFRRLNDKIGTKEIRFYPGLSYRNLLVIKNVAAKPCLPAGRLALPKIRCIPPHDITGKPIRNFLPRGKGSEILLRLMNESEVLLHAMGTKATMIWPWGQGKVPRMPSFREKYKKRAAIITAVHLLKGLGKILGMEVIAVPGATGYIDTNYKGKAEYALKALKKNAVVFVHVEAPDEAGHEGSIRKKIKAIEDFDKLVVGTILSRVKGQGSRVKILVLPDHPTPIKLMTHTADAVPFVIYPPLEEGIRRPLKARKGIKGFNEREFNKAKLKINRGCELLSFFFACKGGGKI